MHIYYNVRARGNRRFLFIIIYILNSINLIDGIDGLASGLSIIALCSFAGLFLWLGWRLHALLSCAALGVLVPFFHFNVFGSVRHGRKIFMGDTGSLTVGLVLAVLAVSLSRTDAAKDARLPGAVVVAFSFLVVPMLDVARLVIHRVRRGKSPFLPDKNHIHHKFMAMGCSQRRAMVSIVLIASAFAAANIFLIHRVACTWLLLADVAVWTLMHVWLSARIRQRKAAR